MKKSGGRMWLVVAGLGVLCAISFYQPKDRIPWRTDYAAAEAEAKQAGKPLLLYFTASWCGPCQTLEHTTFADKAVAGALAGYVPVKLDVDDKSNGALALQYQDDEGAIPFFAVVDTKGTIIRTTVGTLEPGMFVSWLAGGEIPAR